MLKRQLNRFFNALTFYSRIPGPNWVEYSDQQLNRASGYFPFIGYLVAFWCFGLFWLCQFFLPVELSVLISMAGGILFTGAFHEDGFADLCDGFGGGFTQERILEIMKDSRLGTYGVCGLFFMLAIKWSALVSLVAVELWLALMIAHSLSRAWAISLITVLDYVQLDQASKAKPIAQKWYTQDMVLAWVFALAPLALLDGMDALILLAVGAALFVSIRMWFKRKIQGYTGDALGASQQIQEVAIYLTLIPLMA